MAALRLAILVSVFGLASCAEESTGYDGLFADFKAEGQALLQGRDLSGRPDSTLTDAIEWMPTIQEAFARAAKEDKPVLLATFVRENGDPAGDV